MNYIGRLPQALSGTLTVLGTLQLRAFGTLNMVVPSEATPDYYLATCYYFISSTFSVLTPFIIQHVICYTFFLNYFVVVVVVVV